LLEIRRTGHHRRAATAALAMAFAATLTAYLIPTVNVRLLGDSGSMSASERRRVVRTWHRLNVARLAALAVAWWAFRFPSG
jgi:hypothetical protein